MTTSPVANYYFRTAERSVEVNGDYSRPQPKKQWFDPENVFDGPKNEYIGTRPDPNSMATYANVVTSDH